MSSSPSPAGRLWPASCSPDDRRPAPYDSPPTFPDPDPKLFRPRPRRGERRLWSVTAPGRPGPASRRVDGEAGGALDGSGGAGGDEAPGVVAGSGVAGTGPGGVLGKDPHRVH